MGDVVSGLLGKSPKTSSAAKDDTEDANTKSKRARASLFATEGGSSGEELNPEGVKKRPTLLGN